MNTDFPECIARKVEITINYSETAVSVLDVGHTDLWKRATAVSSRLCARTGYVEKELKFG